MQIFQLIRKENPNCAADKRNTKSRLASLRAWKGFSAQVKDMKAQKKRVLLPPNAQCVVFRLGESLAPFLVNKQAKNPPRSPQSKRHQYRATVTSHREARELHHEAITSPDSAANFPPQPVGSGVMEDEPSRGLRASQALRLYFCLGKTNKYLMALRDRASFCVLSPYINTCFKGLLDQN